MVYVRGKGIVISEPSVVAVERGTKKVVAVGAEAKRMLWKTPGDIIAIRPLRDGVIADLETTEKMIRYFISKILPRRWFVKPRMVIGVPTCITEVERRAVEESAYKAGAREVKVIEESLAAAIGADIPIFEPAGHMVCDIGGGTTEISVISLGGMVVTNAIRLGGDEFDESIIKHVRNVHNLIIGEQTAENLKISIGNATADKKIEKWRLREPMPSPVFPEDWKSIAWKSEKRFRSRSMPLLKRLNVHWDRPLRNLRQISSNVVLL